MFETKIKIKFSDCDLGGRIFFAKLFEYAHQVYEEFVLKELFEHNLFKEKKFIVPIVEATANFHLPILLHEEINVNLKVKSLGKHSFVLQYLFLKNENIVAEAETVHVLIDKKHGQKYPLDPSLKIILNKFRK